MKFIHRCLAGAVGIVALNLGFLGWTQTALAQSARIETATGKIRLKRQTWKTFRPVRVGTVLGQGDQLFPAAGVRVKVICPDLSQRSVKPGVPSGLNTICPVWVVAKARKGPAPGVMGGINSSIPYVIAPRHTLLLSPSPLLQWNPVVGTSTYQVHLLGPGSFNWTQQTKESQLKYLGKLQPAVPYSFAVQTNKGKSSQEEGTSNLDFRILRPSEAAIVQTQAGKIVQQNLSKQATALLLAELYSHYMLPETVVTAYGLTAQNYKSYNLIADAIQTVAAVIQQGEQSPIVYRTLGDLYWQSGLVQLATHAYLKAIELAKAPEDLEEQTLAQFGLGEIYAATDKIALAKQSYQQAIEGYTTLGDTGRADFLKQQIEMLEE